MKMSKSIDSSGTPAIKMSSSCILQHELIRVLSYLYLYLDPETAETRDYSEIRAMTSLLTAEEGFSTDSEETLF